MALVERGGRVVSYHVPNVTAATLKPIIADALSTDSHFRTDESGVYWEIGEKFSSHRTVVHLANEYVRGDAHTNTIEGYFSILKCGIYGVYQHVSEHHLKRYLANLISATTNESLSVLTIPNARFVRSKVSLASG